MQKSLSLDLETVIGCSLQYTTSGSGSSLTDGRDSGPPEGNRLLLHSSPVESGIVPLVFQILKGQSNIRIHRHMQLLSEGLG